SVALCLPHRRPPSSTLFPYTTLFRSNPGAQFLATDVATTSLTKTEVLTAAEYSEGIISVPINWTKADEVKNSSENAKIKLVTARSEEHTSELQSRENLVCRLLLEKKK